ncbi:hypothetical protein EDF59_1676 [Novosphingobium sp. ST904]|nr:hypothetical protein EDF59_1676 [Novosphingobium sp. ST904]
MAARPLTKEALPNKSSEETDEQFVQHLLGFASSANVRNGALAAIIKLC